MRLNQQKIEYIPIKFGIVSQNQIFGDMEFFSNKIRSFSVICKEAGTLLCIEFGDFLKHLYDISPTTKYIIDENMNKIKNLIEDRSTQVQKSLDIYGNLMFSKQK